MTDAPPPESPPHIAPLHIAHEDHDHDPSNPHYFGLPIGVILAGAIATIAVAMTLLKFIHRSAL